MARKETTPDIFADIEAAADEDREKQNVDLGPISQLAERQVRLEAKEDTEKVSQLSHYIHQIDASINDIESALKERKKALFQVRQVQIPEMMKAFGLRNLETLSGASIEIKDGLSVTTKDPIKLHTFMEESGAGDLIKNLVTVTIDNQTTGKEVTKVLSGIGCLFEQKKSVHSATLKKYIKGLLEEGKQAPADAVNVYQYEYSKLKGV